jgi:hypothetical protein
VAARGARAAAGDAGDRVFQHGIAGQFMHIVNAFRRGLIEAGYLEHRNVGIGDGWFSADVAVENPTPSKDF